MPKILVYETPIGTFVDGGINMVSDKERTEMRKLQNEVLKTYKYYSSNSRIFEDYNITLQDIKSFLYFEHRNRFINLLKVHNRLKSIKNK